MARTLADALYDVAHRNDPMTRERLVSTYALYRSNHPQDFPKASTGQLSAAHDALVAGGLLRDTGLLFGGKPVYRLATATERGYSAPRVERRQEPEGLFDAGARPSMYDAD